MRLDDDVLHRADFARQNNIVFICHLELVAQHIFLLCPEDEFAQFDVMNDDLFNFLIGNCGIGPINIFAFHARLELLTGLAFDAHNVFVELLVFLL